MLLKMMGEDGEDFTVEVGGFGGCLKLGVWEDNSTTPGKAVTFTVDECRAIIALMQHAIGFAEAEREAMGDGN